MARMPAGGRSGGIRSERPVLQGPAARAPKRPGARIVQARGPGFRDAPRGGTRRTSAGPSGCGSRPSRGYISQLAGLLRGWRTLISTPLTLTREFAGIDSVTNAPPAITVPSPITVSPPSTLALE